MGAQAKHSALVVGWLSPATPDSGGQYISVFKQALGSLGWSEGTQFVIDSQWANGQMGRLEALAQKLAANKPAVIVTQTGQATRAAARAAPHTPIVQGNGTDLVAAGLAASLSRPGGMVTGMTNVQVDVTEKFLELLLAAAPRLKRVGFLADSNNLNHALNMKAAERSAARYRIEAKFAEVARNDEVEPALLRLAAEGVEGLVVLSSPLLTFERKRIIKLSLTRRWPVMATGRGWANEGALLSYGEDASANYRRAAYYVDRILKGTKPGDLPIEQPTKLELVINLKTAKSIGLAIPPELLIRADKVIE